MKEKCPNCKCKIEYRQNVCESCGVVIEWEFKYDDSSTPNLVYIKEYVLKGTGMKKRPNLSRRNW